MIKLLVIAFTTAILSACGGGSDGATTTSVANPNCVIGTSAIGDCTI